MSYDFFFNLNLTCGLFWVLVFPGRLWGVVWWFVTLSRCCFRVWGGLGLLVGFRGLVFGFAFGLKSRFNPGMSRTNNASASNGRLGGRPPSLVCSVSLSGVPSWSLAGDVVNPRVMSGGWVECGGRYYSAVAGSLYPAPGVHRFAARRCGPVESAPVESVESAPVLDDIIYLPCGSPVRRSHIWHDMERVRLAAIERAMGDI